MNTKTRMFNKKASDPKSKPDQVLNHLGLHLGDVVADIGAGGGYFSLRFAEVVAKTGRVFSVDVNPEFLKFIKTTAKEKGLGNLEVVHATESGLSLPENVDLVFMRNVCHHIRDRTRYFSKLKKILRADGRVAILEYRKGKKFTFRGLFGHHVPKTTIIKEMTQAGFKLEEDLDFLSEQSFTIFSINHQQKKL
jgi:arsenite methyltransferase